MNAHLAEAIELSMEMGAPIELRVPDVAAALAEIRAEGWDVDSTTLAKYEDVWGCNVEMLRSKTAWRLRLVKAYLPVPRVDEVYARLLVEAAIFGDANPYEHPAVMCWYVMAIDLDEALEAERWRQLPVLRVQEVAAAVYVEAAVLYLPITRAEAHNLACYIVTETAARAMVRP